MVDDHIVCAASGMVGDARLLLHQMRLAAARHKYTFGDPIPLEVLVSFISDKKQAYTQHGGLRPMGVSFIVGGHDVRNGFQLYVTDPSGNFSGWKAAAVGSQRKLARSLIKQEYTDDMSMDETIGLALKIASKTTDTTNLSFEKVELAKLELDDKTGAVKFMLYDEDALNEVLDKHNLRAEPDRTTSTADQTSGATATTASDSATTGS